MKEFVYQSNISKLSKLVLLNKCNNKHYSTSKHATIEHCKQNHTML